MKETLSHASGYGSLALVMASAVWLAFVLYNGLVPHITVLRELVAVPR